MPRSLTPAAPWESHRRSVLRASPAKSLRFLRTGFRHVKTVANCIDVINGAVSPWEGTASLRPAMFPVYASPVLFVRLPGVPSRRESSLRSSNSATGATLDTGGWLALARQGLAPCKVHQASLGALTLSMWGFRLQSEAAQLEVPHDTLVRLLFIHFKYLNISGDQNSPTIRKYMPLL